MGVEGERWFGVRALGGFYCTSLTTSVLLRELLHRTSSHTSALKRPYTWTR